MTTLYEFKHKYSLSSRLFEVVCKPTKAKKTEMFLRLDTYCLIRQEATAFRVMYYFYKFVEFNSLKHEVVIALS